MSIAPSVSLPCPSPGRRRLLAGLAATALLAQACASTTTDPPHCSGPRRPANPHGSVLAPDVPPTPGAAAGQCQARRR